MAQRPNVKQLSEEIGLQDDRLTDLENGCANLSRRSTRNGRRIFFSLMFVTIVAITNGWVADKHSCERQTIIRLELNKRSDVLFTYMATAAEARFASSIIEVQKDPKQAEIDKSTALLWFRQALEIEDVHVLDCGGLSPDTH